MTGRAEVHPGDALDLREGRRCAAHPFLASSQARLPDFSPRAPPARGPWKGAGGRRAGGLEVVGPRSGRLQPAAGSQKAQCVAEESGRLWSEEQPAHPLQVGAVYLGEEELLHDPMGRDRAAEEANAVLGLDTQGDHMVMLSVIPGEAEDKVSSEPSGGTCGAGGEEDSRCNLRESLFSLDGAGAHFPDREEEYYTEPEVAESDAAPTEDSNNTESLKSPKVNCEESNITGLENFTLKILNMSQDLMDFLNPNGSDCTLVLFYTPWCRFSASLAPHFNSLPRAFPALHFLALDASQHSSLSTRFGTVAVPNILLFQGAKPMARFNHTDRTLETLKIFIFNQTGIEAKKNVVVTQADQIGPLPSTLIKSVDWLLVFSLFFLISFIMYATIRTESIRWLIPGQEQEHVE
ncbi:thioredoxin domain-containing protein 15 isoform X1 [Piliocolobus tephrosceles]|uniref:thioredoxin domain-containing protein 15 isoform X1 n=2 Tax=Piliocolobus tephrosceles TaxID=591936 RepID=UPI000C2AAEFE|nr:thioredoxin domain-containing protein 15 isoform X1 [Piliocolobus tephrosceles]